MTANKTPKKRYLGKFLMPQDIELALHALCEAVKRNGYDYSSTSTSRGEVISMLLSRWHMNGPNSQFIVELVDGEWQRYEWYEDEDDDETQAQA